MKWVATVIEDHEGVYKLSDEDKVKCDKCEHFTLWNVGKDERLFNSKKSAIEYMNDRNLWQCNICKIWWYGHTAVTGGHYDYNECKGGVRHCN